MPETHSVLSWSGPGDGPQGKTKDREGVLQAFWFLSENLNMVSNVILHREGGELAEDFQNGETSRKETRSDKYKAKGDDHSRKGSY